GPGVIVGDLATADIVAPRALTYESTEQTRLAREEARQHVPPQYDSSPERGQLTAGQQLNALEEVINPVDAAFAAVLTPEARQAALRQAIPDLAPAAADPQRN